MSVLTPPVIDQLNTLRTQHPDTSWLELENGTVRVSVPGVELPKGWSSPATTVRFVLPVGYPNAQPDCFWTDAGLQLEGGRTPQNTGKQQIPGTSETLLWFSWHAQSWSANQHSALTWLRIIKKRFELLQ
jgi:hypothetical protein